MAIDWAAGGYHVLGWHARRIDPATWAEGAELAGVRSASVEASDDGDAPLLVSGEVVTDAEVGSEPFSGWLALSATCEQAGQVERVSLAALWCERTASEIERRADSRTLAGRSVLWPCSKSYVLDLPDINGYAPAGCDGVEFAARLVSATTPAPVVARGGFRLDTSIVFDREARVHEAAWMVLRAGACAMRVLGDGTIEIGPRPAEPSLDLDAAHASLLVPSVGIDADTTEVPNRYVAIDGAEVAVAVNDDPTSPVSTVSRGWAHTVRDYSPIRVNGETLAAYAARRLEEESTVSERVTYPREFWPGVAVGDLARASIASAGLTGDLRISRQRIECGRGIPVEEEARREVRLWQRH